MKIIFDIGANKGQNLNYFLDKADIVVAFEANSNLVEKIKSDFKEFIDNKKLIVENIALIDDENIKKIDFYISKVNDVLSTLYPDDISKFYKQEVRCQKASVLIKRYLKNYNISEIEYIKIDIERADTLVLNNLLKNYLKKLRLLRMKRTKVKSFEINYNLFFFPRLVLFRKSSFF